jgi:hypothetical protein
MRESSAAIADQISTRSVYMVKIGRFENSEKFLACASGLREAGTRTQSVSERSSELRFTE